MKLQKSRCNFKGLPNILNKELMQPPAIVLCGLDYTKQTSDSIYSILIAYYAAF